MSRAWDDEASPQTGITLTTASAIRPEPIAWIWPGWLAAGKLHVLAGMAGTGKTTIALAVAATLTGRGRWPDGEECRTAADVVIWSGEDDAADTLVPRLMTMGADLDRVHLITGATDEEGRKRGFDPAADMIELQTALLLVEIEQAGAEIWADGDRLKFQGIPARLVPVIREHKTSLLALLSPQSFTPLPSEQCDDDYARSERAAIRAESMDDTTQAAPMQHSAAMAPQPAPAAVTCGSCARFQPGPQQLSIGRCLATVDGSPPKDQRGYRAAYPMAPRQCPEFSGVQS